MLESRNNILMISGQVQMRVRPLLVLTGSYNCSNWEKVLFIDTDMRKGYTHKLFNIPNDNGLSDVLSGKRIFLFSQTYTDAWF